MHFAPLPGSEFYETRHVATIRQRLQHVVTEFEPITIDHAARLVLSTFGLIKLTAKARAHLSAILKTTPSLLNERDALWSVRTDRANWRQVRVPDETPASKRTVDDIPICELMNCAELVLKQNLSLPPADLARETARAFGVSRLGGNILARLEKAIDALVAEGRASASAGLVIYGAGSNRPLQSASAAPPISPTNIEQEYEAIFLHIQQHGSITEDEVIGKLGSTRNARRFAMELEGHLTTLPFDVRVENTATGKRWVRA